MYLAWLLSMTSLIFRASFQFEDKFCYLEVSPLASYGFIASGDSMIRLGRSAIHGLPVGSNEGIHDPTVLAATYVVQLSLSFSQIFLGWSSQYKGTRRYNLSRLGYTAIVSLAVLSLVFGMLTFWSTYRQRSGIGGALSVWFICYVPCRIAVFIPESGFSFRSLWRRDIEVAASAASLNPSRMFSSLYQNIAIQTGILVFQLVWACVLTPLATFRLPFHLMPQTGAKLTDLDQIVAFLIAIISVLYQWKSLLKKAWRNIMQMARLKPINEVDQTELPRFEEHERVH